MRGGRTRDTKNPLGVRPGGPARGRAFARGGGGFGGGGFGGGGAGSGGLGGGGFGGGGAGGGALFSNISQLFGTIDDALVGESPATITLQNGFR